jgi:hypothetical protein
MLCFFHDLVQSPTMLRLKEPHRWMRNRSWKRCAQKRSETPTHVPAKTLRKPRKSSFTEGHARILKDRKIHNEDCTHESYQRAGMDPDELDIELRYLITTTPTRKTFRRVSVSDN